MLESELKRQRERERESGTVGGCRDMESERKNESERGQGHCGNGSRGTSECLLDSAAAASSWWITVTMTGFHQTWRQQLQEETRT